ncbi:MAG TPA: non-ribosomal peptide synthase/polyketide synthase, partial [Thermoanaerobaculia bacterium]
MSERTGLEIAIIGLAGRFPGAAGVEELWENLIGGVESISRFTDEELAAAGVAPAVLADPRYVKAAPVIGGADLLDAEFFALTPREAEFIDPQHRLLLECSWEALESAGYAPGTFSRPVGVYAGVSFSSYTLLNAAAHRDRRETVGGLLGADKDHLTTLISWKLDLEGPSLAVQTACSTSLVAVHLASQALLNGECDMALAGGVAIHFPQERGYLYGEGGMGSPDGHCRSFDAGARGTVFGNGVGVVVLKRLEDALADGDTIRAVIKGSAVNNDGGRRMAYTAPRLEGQSRVVRAAQIMAEVEPDTIGFVEGHGTATPLGDSIEVGALTEAFRARTDRKGYCALGSVKSNVGHLNTAAGVVGLIKAALALERRIIPPTLHFQRPNPEIDFASTPFFVNTEALAWNGGSAPRRAAVHSFGMGGTNAHVILEEAPEPLPATPSRPVQLLVFSARSAPALAAAAERLAAHLEAHPEQDLGDVAYTLQVGRRAFRHRRIVLAGSREEAVAALRDEGDHPRAAAVSGEAETLAALGRRWLAGEDVDWQAIHDGERRRRVPLPTYPFQRRRYWLDPGPGGPQIQDSVERAVEAPAPVATYHPRPAEMKTAYVAPATAREEAVAAIWRDLFGIAEIGIHDDFFELGGHSVLATRLASRLRDNLGVEVPLREVLENPTVAALAAAIEAREKIAEGPPAPPLTPARHEGEVPLSFAQERLWFLEQLRPGTPFYNMAVGLRLTGDLRVGTIQAALREVVRRHATLRTGFAIRQGTPAQVIAPFLPFEVPVLDLSGLSATEREAQAVELAARHTREPFDLARPPLLRVSLLRLDETEHILLLAMHHIVSDGWSMGVLTSEVTRLYGAFLEGGASPLPELPVQYADYAVWQRGWLQGEALEAQLRWWRERLAGAPAVLDLPVDRPRTALRRQRGGTVSSWVPAEVLEGLRELGQRAGATPFMGLLAGFQALLARYAGTDDVSVGSPISGRNRSELEGLIGFFVNTLVLRTDLSGDPPFAGLLSRARETTLGAYAHQDLPFEKLVEELAPQRDLAHSPLFQVTLVLQNTPRPAAPLSGLRAEPVGVDTGAAKFDLSLVLAERAGSLGVWLEYDLDLFDAATAARIAGHFRTLLSEAVSDPGRRLAELPLMTPEEASQLLVEWTATAKPYARETAVHYRVAARAWETPDAPAVDGLTYRELMDRARRVAAWLRLQGVGVETRVPVVMERSAELVVAALAVLEVGGAYVPLDPANPAERLAWQLEDTWTESPARVLLTSSALAESLEFPAARILRVDADLEGLAGEYVSASPVAPGSAAYVIYTSGSTGRPKGVVISHGSLANLVDWHRRTYGVTPADRAALVAGPGFDAAVWEMWPYLASGASLWVPAEDVRSDPARLVGWLAAEGITLAFLPTPLAEAALAEPWPASSLRAMLTGGDRLHRGPRPGLPFTLHNHYGPTEGTVVATCAPVAPELPSPPIGRPIDNARVYLADGWRSLAPLGVPGELLLGGDGLARGYLHRPDLTAASFVPDPFSGAAGERLYRTGDLARWRPEGTLEFLGRIDRQVKVRGFRIELGEIEAALGALDGVREAVVDVHGQAGEPRLAAWVVPGVPGVSAAELRDGLRSRLPEAMVPTAWVFLEALPLTPNGKVDRRALPPPAAEAGERSGAGPSTPVEQLLAGIWSELLAVGDFGVHDDFFDLGGHSLLATRVISRVREVFGAEVPLQALFEDPTVAGLARRIEDALRQDRTAAAPPLRPVPRDGAMPLSFAQERLWFLQRLEPGTTAYNVSTALRLTGSLDVAALSRTLDEIVRRHEVLRTTFAEDGYGPVQVIHPSGPLGLEVRDLSGLPEDAREAEVRRLVTADQRRPFDLTKGPLLRASLLRVEAEEHVLLFAVHHIASDGWSMGVLVQEVGKLYRAYATGESSRLPELPVQYADYAHWQRSWLRGEVLEERVAWWRERLAGAPALLPLPTDRPRPAVQRFQGSRRSAWIPTEASASLRALGRERGATLFMSVLSAFAVLLGRHSGQDDLVVGTVTANRDRPELEGLIGFFVNTLALRIGLAGDPSFPGLLAGVREMMLGAYTHQALPFEKLVEELQPERSLAHSPLFQVMLALQGQEAAGSVLELPGLTLRPEARPHEISKFDLTLTVDDAPAGLFCQWRYNVELFDAATIDRMAEHFKVLVGGIAADPTRALSALPLLDAAERRQLLEEWSRGELADPGRRLLHEMVEEQAARRPDAPAIVFEGGELTYTELDRRANRLARRLRRLGVGPEVRVGLRAERSPETIVGLLAVLKAGGAYVPIDPAYPAERIAWMRADSGISVLLTQEDLLAEPGESREPLPSAAGPDDLAYVIYTSGSTGTPKGVLVTHRGLDNLAEAQGRLFGIDQDSRVLQFASMSFDASVSEIAMAFRAGAALVLADRNSLLPGPELIELLRDQGITKATLPPSVLAALPEADLPALRTIVVAGEACPVELARRWAAGRRLVNAYGPTETTVCATAWVYDGGDRLPIGRPIRNAEVYVVDPQGGPAPVGVPGELLVGGIGLARGYHNRPDLTAERFVPHPFATGERLYRTGDLVRFRSDGELEFLGRIDHQVKIRGVRVELGEVEAALLAQPGVREAVAVAREDGFGPARLVAYVTGEGLDGMELREALSRSLPEPLVPAVIVALESLPLTPNGKVDRKALPAPEAAARDFVAPRTDLERFLAGLYQEVLGVERVGIHDDFFALGGNSITGAMFVNRLQKELGEIVHVVVMFDAPTVAQLAAWVVENCPAAVARLFGEEARAETMTRRVDEARIAELRALIPPLPPLSAPVEKNPPAVFVLSPPRSGSTLLRVMLGGNPRLFAPPELELLSFDTLEERRQAFPGRNSFWLEGVTRAVMEIQRCTAEEAEALLAELEREGVTTTRGLYRRMQEWIGDRILVDKTPSYALDLSVLRRAEETFEGARYIHLLRHPYGMIRSFEEAKLEQVFFRHPHSFARRELAELIWLVCQRNILEFLAGIPAERKMLVRFEDVLTAPEIELRAICDFLGVEYHPDMAEPYKEKSARMTDGIHAWSRMLGDVKFHQHSGIDRSAAERWRDLARENFLGDVTWDLAEELGYPREQASPAAKQVFTAPPLVRVSRDKALPLSFGQLRLWFLDQLEPGNVAYNVSSSVRLVGSLNTEALAGALNEIIRRHEVLRTTFAGGGKEPVQVVHPWAPRDLPVTDLSGLPTEERESAVRRLALEARRAPFDLARGPLLRASLLRLGEQEHALLFSTHHVVSDGWSMGVLVREVSVLYSAFLVDEPSPLPELPVQYADYAVWQREWLQGEALEAQLSYWRELLAGSPVLQIATDRPRTALQTFRAESVPFRLPREASERLRELGRQKGMTAFMTLLAGFKALLSRYTGQDDVVVGTTVANRSRAELEGLIGFFVNTLALRGDLSGDPAFSGLLARTRKAVLGAFAHQELPFEKLVAELQPDRDLSRSPLFQVLFQLQNAPAEPMELPGLTLRPVDARELTAKFDLVLSAFPAGEAFAGRLDFNSGLFERATAERMVRHYETLLAGVAADPSRPLSELPLLSDEETRQLVTGEPLEHLGVEVLHERFAVQAARAPEAVAAVCDGERLTYGDLDCRANQVANHLVGLGVVPGDLVGLRMERSLEMVAAILGVLKAGAAYVPLDPAYPEERLAYMIEDSRVQVVLTSLDAVEGDASDPVVRVSAEHPAYVIYTSGSTGRPKGVVVRHGNVMRLFSATDRWFGFGAEDVWTLFHSYAFDFSVWEIWGALLYGGRLVVVPYWISRSPEAFYELLSEERVTVLNQTPSAFRQLIWAEESKPRDLALRYVIFGGEALEPASLAPWFERHGDERPRLINMYGITETTVHVTYREMSRKDVASAVGCPIPDLGVYLADPFLNLVPIGVPGEILVGGAGLALGYLNRPELTAERFIPNPFGEPGSRLYRSGDLARRLPDGDLEYLGRIDHQVKIRGFRIELGEIEAALARHPAIREAVVLVRDERLVAWVVGEEVTLSDLRAFAGASLPDYMLPSALVVLDKLPLTANGKVDRRALPDPDAPVSAGYVAPRTPLESFVAGLFQEVLGIERVGAYDNFFELGGNSISGAVLINRLQQELGQIVQVVVIFDYPTVESLAAYLEKEHLAGAVEAERVDEDKLARFATLVEPLTPIHLPRKNRPAVFVLSPPRSGSTLMRVMLGGHPKLFAPPELELLSFNTLRERGEAFSGRDSFWLEGAIRAVMEIRDCGPDEARSIIEECEAEDLTTAAFYGRMQEWLGDRVLVDKTPSYALDPAILRRAEEAFEEPLYLHLIRHPGGMIRSFVEAKLDQIFFRKEHGFSRRELAELIWVASHRNIESFLESVPARRQHWVRFEDLLREPEAVLRGVCGFLGLDYDPAMAEPYRKDSGRMTDGPYAESRMLGDVKFHEHSGVDAAVAERWREEIPESSLGRPARELAERLGYEIAPEPAWSPIERGTWKDGEPLPMSFAQERLWFLDQLGSSDLVHHIPVSLTLAGRLDIQALHRTLAEVVRRHAVLRTRFDFNNRGPVQIVNPDSGLALPIVDLQALPPALRETEAARVTLQEKRRRFDLSRGPLMRALLLRVAPEEHALVVVQHHIASDGWSLGVLVREVGALYPAFLEGRPSPLPELPVQYADYAIWQRGWLQGEALEAEIDWWRQRLAGVAPLELPTDRPRPLARTFQGAVRMLRLSRELTGGLKALSRRAGTTPFMTLLAAMDVLLSRLAGQDDIAVGTPIAGRVRQEIEGLIGCFLNSLTLRTDVSGNPSFLALLGRVRETTLGAYLHQHVPFEKLLEELRPERDLSRTPLFQVFLNMTNAPDSEVRMPGLELRGAGDGGAAPSNFDFTLYARDEGEQLFFGLNYNVSLFDEARAAELLRQLEAVLAQAVSRPENSIGSYSLATAEALALLPDPRAVLSDEWRGTVHELFRRRAAMHPAKTAVVGPEETWSYGELEEASGRIAACLQALGVEKGERVAVYAHRSPSLVAAVLGVLEAGGAFVMLDPAYPAQRLRDIVKLAGVRALIRLEATGALPAELKAAGLPEIVLPVGGPAAVLAALPAGEPERIELGPDDIAYVAFTSGSTGSPKGILGRHGPLSHFLPWQCARFGFSEADRFSMLSGLAHDPLQRDLFTPLYLGAAICVPDPDEVASTRLAQWMAREEVSAAHLTPAMGQVLTEGTAGLSVPSLRHVLLVGDVLTRLDVMRLRRLAPSVTVVNLYGSTETQRAVGYHVVSEREIAEGERGRQILPLGRGMEDVQLLVLTRDGKLAGVGELGEIAVRSPHLAAGYMGDEALTREKFTGDLYRTGDLGRYLPDGEVEFVARADNQVKIRGFRIELGEIEAHLGRQPGVSEAVVVARDKPGIGRRLVAYVVGEASVEALREALKSRLPAYMVPAAFVKLEALPITPNGKVDRKALPEPEAERPAEDLSETRTPAEELLAGIWCEVLGLEEVGNHQDFFDLGGHSLIATQVVSRVRDVFSVGIPLRWLFESPTVAGLARRIEAARWSEAESAAPLRPVSREGALPLSFSQERLWFLDRLEGGGPVYNIFAAVQLTGRLDADRLRAAFQDLVERHESLRTRFVETGGAPAQVIDQALDVAMPAVDLTHLSSEKRDNEVRSRAAAEARHRFDLAAGPLARLSLLRLEEEKHVLLLNMHHVISDGWSMGVLIRDLAAFYEAAGSSRPAALPELPVQYADYALWQREWLQGEVLENQLAWWRDKLAGAPAVLDLPTDRPRPAVRSQRGAVIGAPVAAETAAGLRAASRRAGATTYMTLLAAFQTLLSRYSGGEDAPVGSPIAGRTRSELEGLIGFFVNTLVLRVDLSGDPTFAELLERARETTLGAYAHQDLPFEKLVEELAPRRDLSYSPLFQVMLTLQNAPHRPIDLPGLRLEPLAAEIGTAKFDLSLAMRESGEGLAAWLEYDLDLFDEATVRRLVSHFQTLLAGAAADPGLRLSELPLLDETERQQLLMDWNATTTAYPREATISELFRLQAERRPEAPALDFGGEVLTYGELAVRSRRLAGHLQTLGVRRGDRVGVSLDRSPGQVVCLLAVLEAGAAYVPLDPSYPADRLAFMVEDSGVSVVLTEESLASAGAEPVPVRSSADDLAYVMYTSGSTGRPKGTAIPQRAIVRLVFETDYVSLDSSERIAHASNVSFDAATFEIWGALLHGGCVVGIERDVALSPARFAAEIAARGVTTLFLTTALFNQIVGEAPEAFRSLRNLLFGGEACDPRLVRAALEHGAPQRLLHVYGPTESTTYATWHLVESVPDGTVTVPIGGPLANTTAYVVDVHLGLSPVGVPGELLLGGDGLAQGYWRRPDLTAEKLFPNSFGEAGSRLYRTGDLVRRLPDGAIEFLGRIDQQVKVRGFRIEPGEIEAALVAHPGITAAVVKAWEPTPGDRRLAAWIVGTAETLELRSFLKERLPSYMVPSAFVSLPELPLTPNGKVDRRALPPPAVEAGARSGVEPSTPFEQLLAGIWSELLAVGDVAVHDDFFDLGGHSLLATRLISRVREVFGAEVPLQALFENPTVAGLARRIEEALRQEQTAAAPPLRPRALDGALPLSFSQERLWFLDQLEPGSPVYNIPIALRLSGVLDVAAVAGSLSEVVRRHAGLRVRFTRIEGKPAQIVEPAAGLPLPLADLGALPTEMREAEARRLAAAEAARAFDLAQGPVVRATLLRLEAEEHALLLNMHHIVSDGWSMGVLVQEIATLYSALTAGRSLSLPDLPIQYPDYVLWQRETLQGERLESEIAYWRDRLAGLPVLELLTDRPRPALQTFRGAYWMFSVPRDLTEALAALGRSEGATLFMSTFAVFSILLQRTAGQEDFGVGTPIAGRDRIELEGLIGFFVNTLVLRVHGSGDPDFREWLGRVRETALGAYAHQHLPFERVVEELQPQRDLSRPPLFQVMFSTQNAPTAAPEFPGLTLQSFPSGVATAKFDLAFSLTEAGDGLAGGVEFNTDLFDVSTVDHLARRFTMLLRGAVVDPGQRLSELPLLTPEEAGQIAGWSQGPEMVSESRCVHELLEARADLDPEAVAVVAGSETLTWRELEGRANRLARRLRSLGVGPEVRVALSLSRSPEGIVAIFAILKSGGVYVPIDPSYPRERRAWMLEDSGARVLVTRGENDLQVPAGVAVLEPEAWDEAASRPVGWALPASLAYVIYTSGSTGRPKGVGVDHAMAARHLREAGAAFGIEPGVRLLQTASWSFDVSIDQIL